MKDREDNWKSIFDENIEKLKQLKSSKQDSQIIWFHSASMGEFEQAKPIIELLKYNLETQNHIILATFYSPSGYNNQMNYKYADLIMYLPDDNLSNVKSFINSFNPAIAVFVRYDIWFNYLSYLNKRNIPILLTSATFSNSFNYIAETLLEISKNENKIDIYDKFNWLTKIKLNYYQALLNKVNYIFAATRKDFELFSSLNIGQTRNTKIIQSGDTRIDRIIKVVNDSKQNPILEKSIFPNKKVIVVGSSWFEDELVFSEIYDKLKTNYQIILVPHEPNESHISETRKLFENVMLFSELENEIDKTKYINSKFQKDNFVILVDSIGKLLKLYAIADIAFVGGGFKTGLHSVLEPAGYGLPIICGPKLEKQVDAISLKKYGGLFVVNNSQELFETIIELENKNKIENVYQANSNYIQQNSGKSYEIYEFIMELIKT